MSVIKILSAHLKFDVMFLKELKPARKKARVRNEVYNLNISSHKGEEMAQESRHFHKTHKTCNTWNYSSFFCFEMELDY